MSEASKIEKLTNDNYSTWRMLIEAVCVANNTWDYLTTKIERPIVDINDRRTVQAASEWDRSNAKAKSDLLLSLSTSQVKHLRGLSTAHEMWEKLKEVHEETGDTQIVTLITGLMTKRLTSEDELDQHLEFYTDTLRVFDEITTKLTTEKIVVSALLLSLPESFASIRSAIRTMKTMPSLDDVKKQLREDLRGRRAATLDDANALFVRNPYKNRHSSFQNRNGSQKAIQTGNNAKRNPKSKCEHCGRTGHTIADCRYRKQLEICKKKFEKASHVSTRYEAFHTRLYTKEKPIH